MLLALQQTAIIVGMGFLAWLTIIFIGIICFNFPRRCEKCGKLRVFIIARWDRTQFYTAGGFYITEYKFQRRVCIGCGYEDEEKLEYKSEKLVRG